MKRRFAVVPLAALAIAACSDMSTAPLAEEAPAVPASASFSSSSTGGQALDFTAQLNDVENRMMPGIWDAAAAEQFGAYVTELRAYLGVCPRNGLCTPI
jgi:hypothetical protein